MLNYEKKLYTKDCSYILGTDEAGRGPLCGPLVVAACILPKNFNSELINDSKQMSEKRRESAFNLIIENAIDYQIEVISPKEIDDLNIYQASKFGMIQCIKHMRIRPDLILSDAMKMEFENIPVIPIIKGDAKSKNIAAASILAKVTRDRIMNFYSLIYKEYDLANNKGYGTKTHLKAIEKCGIIPGFHRLSYRPCKEIQLNLFENE